MWGVRDAKLCLRRGITLLLVAFDQSEGHCDPLSGQNVWGSMRLVKRDSSTIIVATQV